ncbi:hypothetical protein [Rhizobium oryzihabitans]|uniref:hypothetical protein n=1 Tax=Rhizobium oryzihabitans TaxID=2267833 RepID=UPI001FE3AB1C|nr:hypothetical protein [Rhizobium oryzihabitans]
MSQIVDKDVAEKPDSDDKHQNKGFMPRSLVPSVLFMAISVPALFMPSAKPCGRSPMMA